MNPYPNYDLIGVSNHHGNLHGGHYIARVDTTGEYVQRPTAPLLPTTTPHQTSIPPPLSTHIPQEVSHPLDQLTAHDHTMTPTLHINQQALRIPVHPYTSLSTQTAWLHGPRTPTTGYAADSSGHSTLNHSHLWSSNTIQTMAAHLASCSLLSTSQQ